MINVIEEEKASAKLLYLFEPNLFNHLKMINESGSDGDSAKSENFIKKMIKNIFKVLTRTFMKFGFVIILTFFLIITFIEMDFFVMVKKAFASMLFKDAFSRAQNRGLNVFTDQNQLTNIKTANFLLDNKLYDEVDVKKRLAYKKVNENGKIVTKKVDFIKALKLVSMRPNKIGLEAKKLSDEYQLSLTGKIASNFNMYNWFGLKVIFDYLYKKAEMIQNYLSDIISLIISIFKNEKVQFSENLKAKKYFKKLIYFKENILNAKKNKKYFFYEELATAMTANKKNENIGGIDFLNNLKLHKMTIKVDDSIVDIDGFSKKIKIEGSNFKDTYKKIFPQNNITTNEYNFSTEKDFQELKNFLFSGSTQQNKDNQTTNNVEKIDDAEPVSEIERIGDNETEIKKDKINSSEKISTKVLSDKEIPDISGDVKNKPPVLKYQIIHKVIKSGLSTYFIMSLILIMALMGTIFSGGTTTVMSASIEAGKAALDSGAGAMDALSASIEGGKNAKEAIEASIETLKLSKETADQADQVKTGMQVVGDFISKGLNIDANKVIGWLGWTSLIGRPTYPMLKGYISKMTADEIVETIERTDNNSEVKKIVSNTTNNIEQTINKIDKENEKKQKKEGFISKTIKKVKNVFSNSTNDSFDYQYKRELLYNENYIVNEYFKLENKMYKTKNFTLD
jgi:hypothetical protein